MPMEQETQGPRDRGSMGHREVGLDAASFQGILGSRRLGTEATGIPGTLEARKRLNEGPWPDR